MSFFKALLAKRQKVSSESTCKNEDTSSDDEEIFYQTSHKDFRRTWQEFSRQEYPRTIRQEVKGRLHLVLKNMDDIRRAHRISFPDSLKSLRIYITGVPCSSSTDKAFSKLIDVVLDRCSNLSSFSTGNLSITQLRKVPVKWPNLKSLSIEQLGGIKSELYTVEDFEYVVENMPNLHILKVSDEIYSLLLESDVIKSFCRRECSKSLTTYKFAAINVLQNENLPFLEP
uniref:Uncharacterized protein n=1 Tax=Romanomermis culicivorax TaxID=13658 RepID=A0A915L778_ROMCU